MQTGRPPKHPRTPFGERLHCAREAAGLSQAQVSEKIGITQNAYATWERHSIAINPQQVEKLAEIFNISVEEFFSKSKSAKVDRPENYGQFLKKRAVYHAANKVK